MERTKNLLCRVGVFLMLCLCFCTLRTSAQKIYSEGYFHYTISDNEVCITSYFGSEAEVVIPTIIGGMHVTAIGGEAFEGRDSVKVITVSEYVTSIAEDAFSGAENLTKVICQSESVSVPVSGNVTVEEDFPVYVSVHQEETESEQDETAAGTGAAATSQTNGSGLEVASGDEKKSAYTGITVGKNQDSVITVDDSGNLIRIDQDNTLTILDRSGDYTMETDADGNVVIWDGEGSEVDAADYEEPESEESASQTDAKAETDTDVEEPESEETDSQTDAKAETDTETEKESDSTAGAGQGWGTAAAAVVVVLVLAAGMAVRRKKKSDGR